MSLTDVQLTLVESMEEVEEFCSWLGERRPVLGVDIETTGLHLARDNIRLVQFGDAKRGWAVPWELWQGLIRWFFQRYKEPIVLHHGKFDASFLMREGITFPWEKAHDTMLMSALYDSFGPRGLKKASARYVDPASDIGEDELKRVMRQNGWTYETIPYNVPAYWGYSALDVVLTARLAETLWNHVQYAREAYDLERACQRVLCGMEMRGTMIDVPYVEMKLEELSNRYEQICNRLGEVSPTNPHHIIAALQRQGIQLTKRTAKGNQLSVDDEVLSDLSETHGVQLAKDVLEARTLAKIIGTYFENFLTYHSKSILHPHINQIQAKTGRMSVTEPALQTIPRNAIVRDAFIPRPGNKLVLIDYNNQELRVAAHFSGDTNMLQAFADNRDLHNETARRLYGDGFTKAQRGTAKNAMFSKAYGAGPPKFARTAGISEAEAIKVFRVLDELYPGISKTMGAVSSKVRERANGGPMGYVQLIDGRHINVFSDKAYVGFNALIQGSCAVVLKQSIVDLDAGGFGEFLNLPIHDEMMFDIPESEIAEVVPEIQYIMTREDFKAPLTVDAKVVDRWGDPYREAA